MLSRRLLVHGRQSFPFARVRRAHLHPGFQIGNLLVGKFPVFRRHLEIGIRVAHRLDQQAALCIARNDGRTIVATSEQTRTRIQPETALYFFGVLTVALVTMLDEHGPNFLFKEFDSVTECPRGRQQPCRRHGQREREAKQPGNPGHENSLMHCLSRYLAAKPGRRPLLSYSGILLKPK